MLVPEFRRVTIFIVFQFHYIVSSWQLPLLIALTNHNCLALLMQPDDLYIYEYDFINGW